MQQAEIDHEQLDIQLFDFFLLLHEGLGGDRALRELRDAGVAIEHIRTLYPVQLTGYLPRLRQLCSSRDRLKSLIRAGFEVEPDMIGFIMFGKHNEALYEFCTPENFRPLTDLARRTLGDADLQELLALDRVRRNLAGQVDDIVEDFARAMLAAHSWLAHVQLSRAAFPTDPNSRTDEQAGLLKNYLRYVREHFALLPVR